MRKISKSSSINFVIIFTVIIKVIGIIRELIFSYYFGATNLSDAYNLAQTIPVTLFSIVSLAIGASLMPIINDIKSQSSEQECEKNTNKFLSNIIYFLVIVCTIVSLTVCIMPNVFIKLFASQLSESAFGIASQFLRISIFSVYFIAMTYVLMSLLKTKKKYFVVTLSSLPIALIAIGSYVLADKFDINFLAIGLTVSNFAQFLVLIISSFKNGFRFEKYFNFKDAKLIEMIRLALPIIIITGLDELNVIIDKNIASSMDEGSISMLSYASVLPSVFHTVITTSVNVVFFAEVSALFAKKDTSGIKPIVQMSVNKSMIILAPICIGIFFFSREIIEVVYYRGAFTYENVIVVSSLLIFYAIQLIPNMFRILSLSILNSNKNTKIQLVIGIISVLANITLNFVLSKLMGINGLALATSLSALIAAVFTMIFSQKYLKEFKWYHIFKEPIILLILSTIIIGLSRIMYDTFISSLILSTMTKMIIVCVFCSILYFGILALYLLMLKKKKRKDV